MINKLIKKREIYQKGVQEAQKGSCSVVGHCLVKGPCLVERPCSVEGPCLIEERKYLKTKLVGARLRAGCMSSSRMKLL